MQKIHTLFVRDPSTFLVGSTVLPGCEWVLEGLGYATRKIDGSACLFHNGVLYKRQEWDSKRGSPPADWMHWSFDPTQKSGHGWIKVDDRSEDWMHRAALENCRDRLQEGCTYELIGPKVNRNPESVEEFTLLPHGAEIVEAPRTFDEPRTFLATYRAEGLVWHGGPAGAMAKLKRKDFGYSWPFPQTMKAIASDAPVVQF